MKSPPGFQRIKGSILGKYTAFSDIKQLIVLETESLGKPKKDESYT